MYFSPSYESCSQPPIPGDCMASSIQPARRQKGRGHSFLLRCMTWKCHMSLSLMSRRPELVTWLHLAAGEPGKYSLYPGIACLIMYFLFSRQVTSNSSRPHGLYHARLLCPPSSPRVCPSSCPINQWCLLIYQDYVPYDNCEAKTICDFWTRFFP